jgi:hypothetical protein
MALGVLSVFSFFLPFVLFVGGAYIAYRGMNWRKISISGPASSSSPFPSHVSSAPCVYSRTVVEYFTGGSEPWKKGLVVEDRAQLSISGKAIDVSKAVFEIGRGAVFKGYVSARLRGTLGTFVEYAQKAAPVELATGVLDAAGLRDSEEFVKRNEYLDDDVVSKLLLLRGGSALKRYFGRPLRVYEYYVPIGEELHVSGTDASAPIPTEVVISDSDQETAHSSMREKGIVRLAIGCGLIVLALMISVLILMS